MDEDVAAALLDPRCGWSRVVGDREVVIAYLADVRRVVRDRVGDVPELEERVDACISVVGGRRQRIAELDFGGPIKLLRSIRSTGGQLFYELPSAFFSERGRDIRTSDCRPATPETRPAADLHDSRRTAA